MAGASRARSTVSSHFRTGEARVIRSLGRHRGREAIRTFKALADTLTPARTPVGDASILADDEQAFRTKPGPAAPARLLPSGDAYFLLWGRARGILVPEPRRRAQLWTTRVWPGAVLVRGEVAGVWRRSAAISR